MTDPQLNAVNAGVLAVVIGVLLATAARYPSEAALVPVLVGIPGLLLAIRLFAQAMAEARRTPALLDTADGRPSHRAGLAWLAVFVALIVGAGFAPGGVAAVMLAQRAWLGESWRTTLVGGVVAAILVLSIEQGLGLPLHGGVVRTWMAR